MIEISPHSAGSILSVRVHAGARRNELRGVQAGQLGISVTQAPEKGKANRAIMELLCRELGLRRSQIELISGESSPRKRLLVRGVAPADLAKSLAALLPPG